MEQGGSITDEPELYGFADKAKSLRIKLKDGGFASLGEVILPNQQAFLDWIAEKRKKRVPAWRFDIKSRQFAAMSTVVGAAITGDCLLTGGRDAIVTAHEKASLMKLSRMYRLFFGRKSAEGPAQRVSDEMFETKAGSQISVQIADEDLGRSGSITHLHYSEADYIEDFEESWRSVKPCLARGHLPLVDMETTLRRGVSSEFRSVMEEAAKGSFPPWEVHFTPWFAVPTLRVALTAMEGHALDEELTEYEVMLLKKYKLSLEQVAWYHKERIGGMFGSLEAMQEAYPSSLEEALSAGFAAQFFRGDAMKFYADNIRDPDARYMVRYDGLQLMGPEDSRAESHLEVWEAPTFGHRYLIGADSSDSEKRVSVEGSECYAVVVDADTGTMCAEWHGYSSATDFALVLYRVAQHFNNAHVIPEVNYSGGAVIDTLRKTFGYANVYQREVFGKTVEVASGVYGFDNRSGTRRILIDRLQRGINDRLFTIPSQYLFKQLKDFAKRDGAQQKRQARGATPDDGVIALALTTFGHRKLLDGTWRPKEPRVRAIMQSQSKPAARGYLISHDDRAEKHRSVWHPKLNMWLPS